MSTSFLSAPLWRRLLAALIDLLAPLTLWALGTSLFVASDPEPLDLPPWNLFDQIVDYLHDRPARAALSFALLLATQLAWPIAFAGRTPGKRALGVRLVLGDGQAPRRTQVAVWALWRLPSLLFAGVGAWWALVDPERRTLHDRLARLWLVLEARDALQAAEAAELGPVLPWEEGAGSGRGGVED